MTSISAITCNKKEGPQVWIADELETLGELRQSSISEKLYHIGDLPYCMGGAGTVAIITRTVEDVLKASGEKEMGYAKDMEDVIKNAYASNYARMRYEEVLRPIDVTWDEFKCGRLKENRDLTQKLLGDLDKFDKTFQTRFLGGGKLSKDNEYRLSMLSGTDITGGQYFCIGSGMLRADSVISDYLERMKSEERKNIPLPLGVRMSIDATQAARAIPGVGGTGQLAYIDKDGFHQLNSNEVRLLHNLVFDEKTSLVDKEFVDKTIAGILSKTTQVDDILKELETKVDPKKLLREHYTGRLQRF